MEAGRRDATPRTITCGSDHPSSHRDRLDVVMDHGPLPRMDIQGLAEGIPKDFFENEIAVSAGVECAPGSMGQTGNREDRESGVMGTCAIKLWRHGYEVVRKISPRLLEHTSCPGNNIRQVLGETEMRKKK
jgi:hypothetical protein